MQISRVRNGPGRTGMLFQFIKCIDIIVPFHRNTFLSLNFFRLLSSEGFNSVWPVFHFVNNICLFQALQIICNYINNKKAHCKSNAHMHGEVLLLSLIHKHIIWSSIGLFYNFTPSQEKRTFKWCFKTC